MPIVTQQDCPTCRKAMLWKCLASPVCPRCEPHKLPEGLADYAPYEDPAAREIRELAESDQRREDLKADADKLRRIMFLLNQNAHYELADFAHTLYIETLKEANQI